MLVVVGLGGFVPSLCMLAVHGKVWSVQHDAPHTQVAPNPTAVCNTIRHFRWTRASYCILSVPDPCTRANPAKRIQ